MSLPKVILLSVFPISTFLFFSSFSYYFFQDDWFVLNWVMTGDFWSFLQFRTDIIYWRPLSMPILFYLADKLFPLNAFAFHLLSFSIFFALIWSTYKLFLLLLNDKKLASIGAFLYGTWPIHYISLSWFSTTSYIIGPLFMVWSIIFAKKNHILSFVFFLLALASSEFALILPGIFFLFRTKSLLPFFAVDLIYLLLRFLVFPIPASGDYQISINSGVLKNALWYGLWSLGIPERFKDLVFLSQLAQSIARLSEFWQVTVPAVALGAFIFWVLLKHAKNNIKNYLFGMAWFFLGLLPVITLVDHSYLLYLSFAGIGFLFIILSALKKANNFLTLALLVLWVLLAYNSLKFTRNTHWVKNEQAISKAYTTYAKEKIPNPQNNSAFVIRPASITFARNNNFVLVEGEDTLRLSLADQNALQVIYGNSTIKSVFLNLNQNVDLPPNIYIYEINPQ